MKKLVIAGSASLQDKVKYWKNFWEDKNCVVTDYPCEIPKNSFLDDYPAVHQKFFEGIIDSDVVFIMNEDKKGIVGYIGAETFAELCFAVVQNLVYKNNIDIVILKMPESRVQSCDEINLWLKLGWIKLYK